MENFLLRFGARARRHEETTIVETHHGEIKYMDTDTARFAYRQWGSEGPVLFCIHGAGSTSASFTVFANSILRKKQCIIIAPDLRQHGRTKSLAQRPLSIEQLIHDMTEVYAYVTHLLNSTFAILIGHSLGGAIAAKMAPTLQSLGGLIVIDVCEESALSNLASMRAKILSRPTHFPSTNVAISWAMSSSLYRCREAASITIADSLNNDNQGNVTWVTNLMETEAFWNSWFKGMDDSFLQVRCPKMLLINSREILSVALMTAHMQGAFSFHTVDDSGHFLHEDQAEFVAGKIISFIDHFRMGEHIIVNGHVIRNN